MLSSQLQNMDMKLSETQQELLNSQDKHRQSLQEFSAKEEELVVYKVELSAIQEKYKAKLDEVSLLETYLLTLF
jgi:predicted nuclease with TOPRIM domain